MAETPAYLKDQLERIVYGFEAQVGTFAQAGSRIIGLRDRARQYLNVSEESVRTRAAAVVGKADGLLKNTSGIHTEALGALSAASALKLEIDTSPVWAQILKGDLSQFGWGYLSTVTTMTGKLASTVSRLNSVRTSMQTHLKNVDDLQGDVAALDDFAQGRGLGMISKALPSVGLAVKGYGSNLVWIAGIAGALWLMLPTLLARTVKRARG